MTDAVATALIGGASTVIVTALSLLAKRILGKVGEVKQICNGRLTDLLARLERAEAACPGITRIPPGMEVKSRLEVNDPSNNEPPHVRETQTTTSGPAILSQSTRTP